MPDGQASHGDFDAALRKVGCSSWTLRIIRSRHTGTVHIKKPFIGRKEGLVFRCCWPLEGFPACAVPQSFTVRAKFLDRAGNYARELGPKSRG